MLPWALLAFMAPVALCELACKPCPAGQFLYPMCSSPSTRVCKPCVAGESWCPDGVYAHACRSCAKPLANCSLLSDAVCGIFATTSAPFNTTPKAALPPTSTTRPPSTTAKTLVKLTTTKPRATAALRVLRPAQVETTEPPTTVPLLPPAPRRNDWAAVGVMVAVALGVVLVLYCCCGQRSQSPRTLIKSS
jgi:hypothetical protein